MTFANATMSNAWIIVEVANVNVGGTNGAASVVQVWEKTSAAATTLTSTFPMPMANAKNRHLSFVGVNINTAAVVPDASFVEHGEQDQASNGLTLEAESAVGIRTCVPTWASGACAIISLELKAAAL